jgi:hypothetical protein
MDDGIFPVDWSDPQSLRAGAEYYRQRAAMPPDHRFERFKTVEIPHDPFGASFEDLLNRPPAEPRVETEFEQQMRTNRAMYEIQRALMEEERQAEQQRQQAQADAKAAFRNTGIGQLLTRR